MRFGWCIFPIFALAGCASQPVIAPNGVVSNNPCIDAVLAEIALPGQVTAISSYSHDPDSASAPLPWSAKLPAIGTGAEELLLAQPKLVLTGNLAASGANAVLARAGVKTVAIGVAPTIAEDIQQIRTIAAALGRVDAGEALISDIHKSLPDTQISGSPMSAIIWQNGGFVAGKGTLQDELLAPQVILMPTAARGADVHALDARQKLLRHLGNRTQIVDFPDSLLFCGGPKIMKVSAILTKTRNSIQRAIP